MHQQIALNNAAIIAASTSTPYPHDPSITINTPSGIDPIRQYQDGMNTYQYVASNPTAYLDPYGLKPLFSMTGFDIQEYDMWGWVKGGFGIPIYTYLHGGLVVNNSTVDFGPENAGALAGPGHVPHGSGPGGGWLPSLCIKGKRDGCGRARKSASDAVN